MSSRPLLTSGQEYLEEQGPDVIQELKARIDRLNERVEELESSIDRTRREAVVTLLNLLGKSLRQVASGEFDIEEVSQSVSPALGASSKWDAIKQRNPGRVAEVIDLLLIYGPLNQSQIAANLKIDPSNVSKNVIPKLVSMGLVVRDGGKIKLRD